jgi:hypothetical protein
MPTTKQVIIRPKTAHSSLGSNTLGIESAVRRRPVTRNALRAFIAEPPHEIQRSARRPLLIGDADEKKLAGRSKQATEFREK